MHIVDPHKQMTFHTPVLPQKDLVRVFVSNTSRGDCTSSEHLGNILGIYIWEAVTRANVYVTRATKVAPELRSEVWRDKVRLSVF